MRTSGDAFLLLDAGNSIFSGARQGISATSEGRITVEAMNLMGYDAMAIGARDLEAGLDLLRARMAAAEFAVLSANLEVDGEPLGEPFVVVERDGLRMAILGLTAVPANPLPGVAVADPIEAGRQYLPRLRQEADVVVVLANVGPTLGEQLLAALPEADLVINGGVGSPSRDVVGAPVPGMVRAGGLGEYLGVTDVALDGENRATTYRHRSVPLDPTFSDDQEMTDLKTRYMEEYGAG